MENLASISDITLKLHEFQRGKYKLRVEREELFDTVVKFLLTDKVELKQIFVEFVVHGYCEPAHDEGGLSRELFTIFFQECLSPERGMFEGEGRNLLPVESEKALNEKWFYCLGKAIVLSLVVGGSGFPYFSRSCFSYITDTEIQNLPDLKRDINDKLRSLINEVENATSEEALCQRTQRHSYNVSQLLKDIEWPSDGKIKIEEKLVFTQTVLKWYLLDKRKQALDQLKEGLKTLDFLKKAKHCSDFEDYLVYNHDKCVNSDYIRCMLLPKLADLKSANEHQEEIKQFASHCLMELSDEQSVDLYQFTTSMRNLPSRPVELHVAFNHQNPGDKLPRAVTCANLLLLPLGNQSNKEFVYSFKTALENREVFGRI